MGNDSNGKPKYDVFTPLRKAVRGGDGAAPSNPPRVDQFLVPRAEYANQGYKSGGYNNGSAESTLNPNGESLLSGRKVTDTPVLEKMCEPEIPVELPKESTRR